MTQKKRKPRRKLIIGLTITLTTVGAVLYGLADRYLIEHVEVVVQPASAAGTAVTAAASANSSTESNSAANQATSDDWNYSSDTTDIAIKKVENGTGEDKITYYVADVQVKEASKLLTAFADNAFGRNITEATSEIASANNAIFAVNGDYYGFRNDGVIIRNGTLYRNEPARDGLALYSDGTMKSYNEEEVSADELLASGVTNTFSFGPVLVKNGEAIDNFDNLKIDTNFGNRSIDDANPRTGIGVISPNHYVFVVVDGRQENYSRGMTLDEFAQLFKDLGVTEAYNLDGGGSSTMYFMGRVVNSPGNRGNDERGVSDIIYLAD
ncbi:phosphodiester glycosidase family protein [Paenibacillus montanisoli]|uniref:Phosphodiester glycosidase family protein n=1 Tax=Paenibacillus montanisoli TaxID=2081970 RepID=A0A328U2X7_9BACL|nr:phosphodiester glycosidase family protein [Paenibacillus montanisoli]RAP75761.1 phosphodiester glycosidase family protein [Paenibacillus montanisoli]